MRPATEEPDVFAAALERGPSAFAGGRTEDFIRLPFRVFRDAEDTVGLEATGGVELAFLPVDTIVRFGGIPFCGDALYTFSRAFSCFLATIFLVGVLPDSLPPPVARPFSGESAMVTSPPE